MGGADFLEGGFFGFVGDGEAGEVGERWEGAGATRFEEMFSKSGKIGSESGLNGGMVGLESLNNDFGVVEVSATDASDDLIEKFVSALFGGKIRQSEPRIGLDDADGGEEGKIEAAGEGLGADEEVELAGFDGLIKFGEGSGFGVVAVKTGDFGFGKEDGEFGFEEFSAEAFMDDAGVMAGGAAGGDFGFVAADVATEDVVVGVEGEREVAIGAEGLPTAFFADGERGRAAAIVEDEGLMTEFEVVLDGSEEGVGKITVADEVGAIFEVDDFDVGGDGGGFGFFGQFDEGRMGGGEVIIDDIGGGSAEDGGDF